MAFECRRTACRCCAQVQLGASGASETTSYGDDDDNDNDDNDNDDDANPDKVRAGRRESVKCCSLCFGVAPWCGEPRDICCWAGHFSTTRLRHTHVGV